MADFFKIPHSSILTYLLMREGFLILLFLGTLTLLSIVLSIFVDLRFIAIAFLIIAVITPMVIAYLYFYHALKPLISFNVLPHTVTKAKGDLLITIRISFAKNESSDSDTNKITERENLPKHEEGQFRKITIPIDTLGSPEEYKGKIYLPISGKEGLLIFPSDTYLELFPKAT